ncbi:MAG: hypothetical protein R3348_06270 [Xanthomonadales bacterium]|nr:hypothetical protein [Xanthomonadales bacterium]
MKRVAPSRAAAWLGGSIGLLRTQALRLILIGLILQFLSGLGQAGVLGFLVVLAIPALSAGVLEALHMSAQGLTPPVMTLFSAFQARRRLVRLFLLATIMLFASLGVAGLVLSDSLQNVSPEWTAALERGDVAALVQSDPELLQRIGLAALGGLAVSGILGFFTIPLIWFHGLPLARALGAGLSALLVNLPAMLVMVLLMASLAVPLVLLVSLLLSAGGSTLVTLLMLLLAVAYQVIAFGVQLFAFGDVFGLSGGSAGPDSSDQLVA